MRGTARAENQLIQAQGSLRCWITRAPSVGRGGCGEALPPTFALARHFAALPRGETGVSSTYSPKRDYIDDGLVSRPFALFILMTDLSHRTCLTVC
jgi:hypothetical protein